MSFLDFIAQAEGTDVGAGYDEVLGYGRFGRPDKPLTQMTLDEVYNFGRQMLAHPDNRFNSSAAGRYQIVGNTLRDLQARMNLPGDTIFSPGIQDRMAYELARRRGLDAQGLRSEWQGLEKYSDDEILRAFGGVSEGGMGGMMRPLSRPPGLGAPAPQFQQQEEMASAWQPGQVFLPHEHMKMASAPRLQALAQQKMKGLQ